MVLDVASPFRGAVAAVVHNKEDEERDQDDGADDHRYYE